MPNTAAGPHPTFVRVRERPGHQLGTPCAGNNLHSHVQRLFHSPAGLRLTELEHEEEGTKNTFANGQKIWFGFSRKVNLESMSFIEVYKLNEAQSR